MLNGVINVVHTETSQHRLKFVQAPVWTFSFETEAVHQVWKYICPTLPEDKLYYHVFGWPVATALEVILRRGPPNQQWFQPGIVTWSGLSPTLTQIHIRRMRSSQSPPYQRAQPRDFSLFLQWPRRVNSVHVPDLALAAWAFSCQVPVLAVVTNWLMAWMDATSSPGVNEDFHQTPFARVKVTGRFNTLYLFGRSWW